MTITLNLPADLEQRLRETEARGDEAAFRELLVEAVEPTVKAQLHRAPPHRKLSREEFKERLGRLQEFVASASGRTTPLPDEAYSRASIYVDHD